MYLLILSVRDIVAVGAPHLHSNMYLLIPVIAVREALYRVNLHSNMYLLILRPKVFLVDEIYKFTFQHVSINSVTDCHFEMCLSHLHSNMYLLIQYFSPAAMKGVAHLHSNMYLLIPRFGINYTIDGAIYIPTCIY